MTNPTFEARLAGFIPALDAYVADYYTKQFPNNPKPTHEVQRGPKYVRVIQRSHGQRSAFCFLDHNGTIYKCQGWKGPMLKNPRGSIFDDNYSLGKGLTPYGAAYLR